MINFAFFLSLAAASALTLLTMASYWRKEIQFWPPSDLNGWQYRTFWVLFRLLVMGAVVLAILDFQAVQSPNQWWRYLLGLPLTVLGFGSAFYATFYLGWDNAHGAKEGLKTDGWYRWSRNPIYVVTIIGMVGLGLFVNSGRLWVILAFWIGFYVVAPFLEEPWLEQTYGSNYLAYKKRVPRFVGLGKII